ACVCGACRREGAAALAKIARSDLRSNASVSGDRLLHACVPRMPSFRKSSVNSVPCGIRRLFHDSTSPEIGTGRSVLAALSRLSLDRGIDTKSEANSSHGATWVTFEDRDYRL